MRFHVPNNELDEYKENKAKEREEKRQNEESKNEEIQDSDEDDDMTAAKLFDQKVHKKANIG